jgi:hypothetical protein
MGRSEAIIIVLLVWLRCVRAMQRKKKVYDAIAAPAHTLLLYIVHTMQAHSGVFPMQDWLNERCKMRELCYCTPTVLPESQPMPQVVCSRSASLLVAALSQQDCLPRRAAPRHSYNQSQVTVVQRIIFRKGIKAKSSTTISFTIYVSFFVHILLFPHDQNRPAAMGNSCPSCCTNAGHEVGADGSKW